MELSSRHTEEKLPRELGNFQLSNRKLGYLKQPLFPINHCQTKNIDTNFLYNNNNHPF